MGKENEDPNILRSFARAMYNTVDAPVTWFRGKINS